MKTILRFLKELRFANKWFDVQRMGHLKECSFLSIAFGYERWGTMCPGQMWTVDGKCYVPLILGIWKRDPEQDS